MEHDNNQHASGHDLSNEFFVHALTPQHVGMMSGPDGSGKVTGGCGDTIEVFLKIKDDSVEAASFMPQGCLHTVACGDALTTLAEGRSLDQALALTPDDIETELGGLPADHRHCAELACQSLWEAAMDFYRSRRAGWKKMYT